MSKNVKQYLISCPTLVSRYVSLNILSKKAFTLRECFSPNVRLGGGQLKIRILIAVKVGKFKVSKALVYV